MTIPLIQPSFAAGEMSPFLYGRIDLAKFKVGARILQGFFVHPQGGASNDSGTRFIGEVDDSTKRHRLIPFEFRTLPSGQTYALVFGDKTMQVVMFNGTTWGFVEDTPGHIYTLATSYVYTDLPLLKFVQSADTMTLTHPAYAPMKLTRTGHAAWTLTTITFAPTQSAPVDVLSDSVGTTQFYQVTAISDSTGEESLPSNAAGSSTATSKLAWTALQGCTNYNIYKKSATGNIYGFVGQVQAPSGGASTSFTDATIAPDVGNTPPQQRNPFGGGPIIGITGFPSGTGYTAPTATFMDAGGSGGSVDLTVSGGVITGFSNLVGGRNYSATTIAINDGTGAGAIVALNFVDDGLGQGTYTVTGATVTSGGAGYHSGATAAVYYLGVFSTFLTLTVTAGAITAAATPAFGNGLDINSFSPVVINDSAGIGAKLTVVLAPNPTSNPQCTAYYQQRQAFAGTLAQPQTLWFSDVGAFNNMAVSQPTKDSDAITRTLVGQQVNEIRHMVPVGTNMLIMTSGAEWRCWPGPQGSALTPAACFTLPQTSLGCSHVPPFYTENTLIFSKQKGSGVYGLTYDAIQDIYAPSDLTVMAGHMLADTGYQYQIEEWAFAASPDRICWAVRSDGVLLGFTFMREHDVKAWHRHPTHGKYESVCTITEPDGNGGYEDAVYFIVNRTIGGVTKRYVERKVGRTFTSISKAWFLDCALQYSGVPVTQVSGLDHLEGQTVAILGDGSVVPSAVVSGGIVHLDGAYSTVTVGLAQGAADGSGQILTTLNLEVPGPAGTSQGQMKKISQVTVRVKDARGISVGIEQEVPYGSTSGTPVTVEVKQRWSETLGTAMQPFSGDYQVTVPTEWNRGGRLVIKQIYPLPCTILDIIPEVNPGD